MIQSSAQAGWRVRSHRFVPDDLGEAIEPPRPKKTGHPRASPAPLTALPPSASSSSHEPDARDGSSCSIPPMGAARSPNVGTPRSGARRQPERDLRGVVVGSGRASPFTARSWARATGAPIAATPSLGARSRPSAQTRAVTFLLVPSQPRPHGRLLSQDSSPSRNVIPERSTRVWSGCVSLIVASSRR